MDKETQLVRKYSINTLLSLLIPLRSYFIRAHFAWTEECILSPEVFVKDEKVLFIVLMAY